MRDILRTAVSAAALCMLAAGALRAGLTGGDLHVLNTIFNAGGGNLLQGGTFVATGAIGEPGITPMAGGGFTLNPGVVASQAPPEFNLEKAHAFPVPFVPSRGHRQIVFTDLTETARIRVYTISGELVTTIEKRGGATDRISWTPVVNSAGQVLASGVYIFYVDTPDDKTKRGKLMVIR